MIMTGELKHFQITCFGCRKWPHWHRPGCHDSAQQAHCQVRQTQSYATQQKLHPPGLPILCFVIGTRVDQLPGTPGISCTRRTGPLRKAAGTATRTVREFRNHLRLWPRSDTDSLTTRLPSHPVQLIALVLLQLIARHAASEGGRPAPSQSAAEGRCPGNHQDDDWCSRHSRPGTGPVGLRRRTTAFRTGGFGLCRY